jgi:8-oxo-dGTP diphosphatase
MTDFIDKIAWTPIRGRAVLFARSRDHELFYSVGGKREEGETDAEALIREVLEETSAHILRDTIKHICTFEGVAHGKAEGTRLRVACYDAQVEGEPIPSNEVNTLEWFTTADGNRTTDTGREILAWHKERGFID